MSGIIMDFEGQAIDTLKDAVVLLRDIVDTNDEIRARAFRDAWRAVDPEHADDNLVYASDWAYKRDPGKTRHAMHLLGVTKTLYGTQAPADALRPAWEHGVKDATPSTLEKAIEQGVVDADQYAASLAEPESEPTA